MFIFVTLVIYVANFFIKWIFEDAYENQFYDTYMKSNDTGASIGIHNKNNNVFFTKQTTHIYDWKGLNCP